MDFWEKVAEQTSKTSVGYLAQVEKYNCILHLTRIGLVMGTLTLLQAKLYWSILLWLLLVSYSMPRDKCFKLRNNLHFVNNLGAHDADDKLWKIRPLIDVVRKKCCINMYCSLVYR
jgi:hypothetical protein